MMPEQAEAHGKPVALLRPSAVRELVALLRLLTVRERTTILAQAVHEGTMTRVGADQVLFALAFDGTSLSAGDTRGIAPCLDDKRNGNASAKPADVSGQAIPLVPVRAIPIRCEGGRYAPKRWGNRPAACG